MPSRAGRELNATGYSLRARWFLLIVDSGLNITLDDAAAGPAALNSFEIDSGLARHSCGNRRNQDAPITPRFLSVAADRLSRLRRFGFMRCNFDRRRGVRFRRALGRLKPAFSGFGVEAVFSSSIYLRPARR